MINSQTLSNPVFLTFLEDEIKSENKKGHVNPPLFEKMVNALILVESLQKEGLNFTFKGGTSLVLLLRSAKIMKNDTTQLEKFDSSKMSLINFMIESENTKYNFINKKVKNTGNNALFYWKKAIELISN